MSDTKNTLNQITVTKDDLLKSLKENLAAHDEVFNASTQAYYESLRAELEEKLDKSKKLGKILKKKLGLVTTKEVFEGLSDFNDFGYFESKKPTSYESSYKAAIRKVELSVEPTFTLTDDDFQKYILNNWEWRGNFLNVAASYSKGIHTEALMSGMSKFNK